MQSYIYNDDKIRGAIKNNLVQNYVYATTDNLYSDYMRGDMQPTNIFPEVGVVNNIEKKNYNDDTLATNKNVFDIKNNHNPPIFHDEDDVLSDRIHIGNKKSVMGRIIGTSIY